MHFRFGRTFNMTEGFTIDDYTIFYIGGESLTLTNHMMTYNKCQVRYAWLWGSDKPSTRFMQSFHNTYFNASSQMITHVRTEHATNTFNQSNINVLHYMTMCISLPQIAACGSLCLMIGYSSCSAWNQIRKYLSLRREFNPHSRSVTPSFIEGLSVCLRHGFKHFRGSYKAWVAYH